MTEFEYYKSQYYGDLIPQEKWHKYSYRAKAKVDLLTFGRTAKMDHLTPEVNSCVCAIAEYLFNDDMINNGMISSESTDGHSVTYVQKTNIQKESDIKLIAIEYLANTGLMYPGESVIC